ncbi:MAG TPA: phosphotransferase [Polyangiaceae bacterium]|nr:phosphotransferase [Polyangiaceae bacterium]
MPRLPQWTLLELSDRIRRGTGASRVELGEPMQSLWGGYGELRRAELQGVRVASAIVKIVTPPAERELARDPAKLRSHRRKLRSYAVELSFYQRLARTCDAACRVPALLHGEASDGRFLFVLEDLSTLGFPARRTQCAPQEIAACLGWLAAFHARFLGASADGLWKVGTYWQLATRPDELARLGAGDLRRAAAVIDERLNSARFRSLVHGDAKLENFCFAPSGPGVAAVDFQYVGGGVGVKDVAYFLSSCLSPGECAELIPGYLELYFDALRAALGLRSDLPASQADALEREWRALFPWAWTDFYRFLLGWAPAYAAGDHYSQTQLQLVLEAIR